jgi:hypothetical protein
MIIVKNREHSPLQLRYLSPFPPFHLSPPSVVFALSSPYSSSPIVTFLLSSLLSFNPPLSRRLPILALHASPPLGLFVQSFRLTKSTLKYNA